MTETILLLWGRNDDGQLGSRRHSLSIGGSPHPRHVRRSSELSAGAPSVTLSSPTKQVVGHYHNDSTNSISRSRDGSSGSVAKLAHEGSGPASTKSMGLSRGPHIAESFSSIPIPCAVLSNSHVLQVSCGSRHTLAIVAGGCAYSWGWGANGQLGHGDNHSSAVPRVIEGLQAGGEREDGGAVTWVSAGGIHSAAVVETGAVYTWGESSYGQVCSRARCEHDEDHHEASNPRVLCLVFVGIFTCVRRRRGVVHSNPQINDSISVALTP